jgi:hypothetical protein
LLLLGFAGPARGALPPKVDFSGVDVTVQIESAIGEVPGHWSLTKQGFRNQYLPDSGFGNGVFSVPLDAPAVLAFDLDSVNCVPCVLVKKSEHQLRSDSRHRNSYACGPGMSQRRAFFLASVESVGAGVDPGWVESKEQAPRFPVSASPGTPLHFHEWITTKEIAPGKRLACGAWFEGAYPPKKEYSEVRGDTVDVADYIIRDRAIYLIGTENQPEYLFRSCEPSEAWKSTFELAFLPPNYSELERVRFAQIYSVREGFWLRANVVRDFEGAGAEEGILLLEFRNGQYRLLAGATEVRMY